MELNDWVILLTALGGIEGIKSLVKLWINRRNEGKRETAIANKAEADTITAYASEWKELYEKEEKKGIDKDAKIDKLYEEKNKDRQQIRELMQKNTQLEIENIKLVSRKCNVPGCVKRQPPSDF